MDARWIFHRTVVHTYSVRQHGQYSKFLQNWRDRLQRRFKCACKARLNKAYFSLSMKSVSVHRTRVGVCSASLVWVTGSQAQVASRSRSSTRAVVTRQRRRSGSRQHAGRCVDGVGLVPRPVLRQRRHLLSASLTVLSSFKLRQRLHMYVCVCIFH